MMKIGSRNPLTVTARILYLVASACLALGLCIATSTATLAQETTRASVPAFAAAPRFTTGNLLAARPGGQAPICDSATEKIQGDTVELDLHLERVDAVINNPSDPLHPIDQLNLRSYNGCLTAPEIDAKPGTSLRIALHNDLSPNDPTCGAAPAPYLQLPPGVGCFNTTNLHTHGLHVSPSGISDNVLLSVAPGTTQPYRIDIPADHPSGTFWYHAHQHGSTAVGLASADGGVLIVRGNRKYDPAHPHAVADIDTILHGADQQPFPEKVFVLQQLAYGCFWTTDPSQPYDNLITTTGLVTTNNSANANSPWTCNPDYTLPPGTPTKGVVENFDTQLFSSTVWDTNGRFTSINGLVQPALTLPAGQIERWRFVHAGVHDTINLQVVKMTQMAQMAQNLSGDKVPVLSDQLSGKTRVEQAAIINQVCNATAQTLIPQFEIAQDGLTRTHIREINRPGEHPMPIPPTIPPSPPLYPSNYLQPGYRSDVLVVFPSDGEYCLLDQSAPPSERVDPTTGASKGQGPSIPQLLAYVHVSGGHAVQTDLKQYVEQTLYAGNPHLPTSVRNKLLVGNVTPWAPFTELAPPPLHPEPYVHFQIGDTTGAFTVNGLSYNPSTVNPTFIRKVGTTDDWSVQVEPQPQPSPSPSQPVLDLGEPHIFHIHVNPFEVVDIKRVYYDPQTGKLLRKVSIYDANGECRPEIVGSDAQHLANQYCGIHHVFRDTLFIEDSFEATLRTHYARYTGEFVLHCHILDHEDAGMMANVEIVDDPAHPPTPVPVLMPAMQRMTMTQP
ncbi:MAG TPA: multicopper oxidase domain-containing protein [Candidatus Baltobacteraceae bacterium]|jgi:FtsP/CotA-like multicopper oxidase with cupredoxin domain|nr:multicopper oxidase domain-containing protein [Candidatus Baltobacteraceae bacterium]